jgi:hypothetical protein
LSAQECKINTAHILRQIINERDNPLSILREAISNSKDAHATQMKVTIERKKNGKINVSFFDNGIGMTYQQLNDFFNIGYSQKRANQIGEKGLGTKLFFNCDEIVVETKSKKNKGYRGRLKAPIASLNKGIIPTFKIEPCPSNVFNGYHTKIFLHNLKINDPRPLFWGNNLENYILWNTAAGSVDNFFKRKNSFELTIETKNNGKSKSSVISGHVFPQTNRCNNPENFAYQFDPFEFNVKVGKKNSKVQVVGAIVGANAHIIKDKRIKKQFKGFFLCKDHFIIRDVNKDIFGGGTGEWQNMHILVNCQAINLSMGREGFIDKGEGTVFYAVIEAIRLFKNSIINGARFKYNGQLVEKTSNFAGRGYEQLRDLKENHNVKEIKCMRSLRLMQIQDNTKILDKFNTNMIYEPTNKISTFTLFLELLSKDYVKDSFTIYDVNVEDKNISLLMGKNNGKTGEIPRFYTIEHIVDDKLLGKLHSKYEGLICWNAKKVDKNELSKFQDIIILRDLMQ